MTIEYRTCLYCGKEWRTGTMDLNRYCSTGCWADDLDTRQAPAYGAADGRDDARKPARLGLLTDLARLLIVRR